MHKAIPNNKLIISNCLSQRSLLGSFFTRAGKSYHYIVLRTFSSGNFKFSHSEVYTELLEAGAGEVAVVVNAVEERVDLDRRLSRGRQRALRALALSAETADRALVTSEILTSSEPKRMSTIKHDPEARTDA